MPARKKTKHTYEEGIAALETLVGQLSGGDLSLEASMQTYEQGMALVAQLEQELEQHRKRIEQLDADTGEIRAFEEKEYDI